MNNRRIPYCFGNTDNWTILTLSTTPPITKRTFVNPKSKKCKSYLKHILTVIAIYGLPPLLCKFYFQQMIAFLLTNSILNLLAVDIPQTINELRLFAIDSVMFYDSYIVSSHFIHCSSVHPSEIWFTLHSSVL